MSWLDNYYICEPSKNHSCKMSECYVHGGECFLTHDEKAESPYISKALVEKLSPNLVCDLLPRTLQQIRSQKIHSL